VISLDAVPSFARTGEAHRANFSGARRRPSPVSMPLPLQALRRHQGRARRKSESPERTAILTHLQREYAIDAVQFYDNNFFLREADAADLAARITPLKLKRWCEGRIDALLRYSDETMHALRRAGCEMIFLGAESGSDKLLREMDKQLTSDQILEIAARIRKFGIIPEFSFVIGNPNEPDRDAREAMSFMRRIKRINPRAEIIVQHYIPTPHPDGMYGEIEERFAFPKPGRMGIAALV
jgi:radical SAM superfamily enzyme YgiQ (UPF0313 family)